MKKAKKGIGLVMSVAMGATLLSGSAVNVMAADEEITITVVESLTSAARTAIIREIADKYEEEHPNITIEIVSPPIENADNKITQMLMSSSGCDIVESRDYTITQFINNGWVAPLDSYIENWEGKDTLVDATDFVMYGGSDEAYMMPYGFFCKGLYVHTDMLEEAGLEIPTTWQELYDAGVALTNPDENRFGYAFRGATLGYLYADNLVMSFIGPDRLAGPEAGYFLKDEGGKTIFTLPETKEALEFYKSVFKDCAPADSIAWGFSEMVQGFIGGTAAMLIQDPEVISSCEADLEDGTWELAKYPLGPSGKAANPLGYAGWSMTSFTEHPDEVADFLLYLSNAENNTYFCRNYATIPIHSTAAEMDSYFKDGPFANYMEMINDTETYVPVTAPLKYNAFASYKSQVDTMYQSWLTDEITTDDLMKWLDDYWTQAYADEGEKF